MKKLLIYLSIFTYLFSFTSVNTYASITHNTEISKIENELFGFDYKNEDINKRVARLEKTIYGKESNGDINKRVDKISKDITADQIGLEIEPKEDSFAENEAVADNIVNYPIVDEIEMKIFNKTQLFFRYSYKNHHKS